MKHVKIRAHPPIALGLEKIPRSLLYMAVGLVKISTSVSE